MIDARDLRDMIDMVRDIAKRDARRRMRRKPFGIGRARTFRLSDIKAAIGRLVRVRTR